MPESLDGKRFAITGGIAGLRRRQIIAAIEAAGGAVTDHIYSRLRVDGLIICDTKGGQETNKLLYADRHQIEQIDFDEFAARYGLDFDAPQLAELDEVPTAVAGGQPELELDV